ncbi:YPDG domain-containing protein, partial [Corynebacterium macclintockiae]
TKEEFDVPVTVTYPDGSTDDAKAKFKLDTDGDGKPDTTDEDDDNDSIPDEVEKDKGSNPKDKGSIPATPIEPGKPTNAATFEPEYEDGSGKPGTDVTVPAPTFKDKDGKDTTAPEGTKFTPGDNAPEGVKVDPNTGAVTVPVPADAKPGDKITVPVVVTYPDGTKDNVDVTVTVEQPDAPAEKPDWKDDSGKPGDKVEIPNDGGDVPAGTTTEVEGPGKAEIDENGKLVVDIDKDAKPGDKITVIVKDKDGNEIDRVVVEVEQPDAPAEKPDWKDDSGKPGDKVEIPNDGGDVPAGTTTEVEGPGKAEIDENGKLVVDIDKDAKPGDKITVIVKDKDGNEIDRVVVEVEQPGGPVGSVKDPNKIGAIIGGTIVGSGLIGALLGNHGDGAGSSAPGKPGEAKPGKPGAEKPGKPGKPGKGADKGAKPGKAGDQGAGKGADNGAAGNQSAGKGSTGATSQSTEAGSRGGSLAVTGVSGLAITLGASVIALALGGALMALRRRQS